MLSHLSFSPGEAGAISAASHPWVWSIKGSPGRRNLGLYSSKTPFRGPLLELFQLGQSKSPRRGSLWCSAAFPGQGERLQRREMLIESSTNTFAKLSAPAELLFAGKQLQTDTEMPPDSVEEPPALQCLPPKGFSHTFFPREGYLPIFPKGFGPPSTNHFTHPGL